MSQINGTIEFGTVMRRVRISEAPTKTEFDAEPIQRRAASFHLTTGHVVLHVAILATSVAETALKRCGEASNLSQNPRNLPRRTRPLRFRDREAPGSNPGPPTNFPMRRIKLTAHGTRVPGSAVGSSARKRTRYPCATVGAMAANINPTAPKSGATRITIPR